MINAQSSSSTRKENQFGVRIKTGVVDAGSDRIAVNYFSSCGVHHHHFRLVAATDEQTISLCIVGQTGRCLSHADWKTLLDLQRFRIEHDYLGSVLAVDVDKSIFADDCLFAIAFRRHRAHHVAGGCIDRRDVV